MRTQSTKEVSTVFRAVLPRLSTLNLSPDKQRVVRSIVACRTAELGGHISSCSACGYAEQSYNSCWNRHCPKCQGGAAFNWTEKRLSELLPVPYFHVVFTLPKELRPLCYANKKEFYNLFFKASSETLLQVGLNNEKVHLGLFAVLHTWNQDLEYHPHLHYLVPAGGITETGSWQTFTKGKRFFLPVRILSQVFCGKLVALIKKAYTKKKFYLKANLSHLQNPREFESLISKATKKDWVVYAKRPFAGPETVVKYLSNYTHRVAISNHRIRKVTPQTVSFSARHRTKKGKKRLVTLPTETFVRRFLLHTLPRGFRRIRYFGYLSNDKRTEAIKRLQKELNFTPLIPAPSPTSICPECTKPSFSRVALLKPHRIQPIAPTLTQKTIPLCLSPPN